MSFNFVAGMATKVVNLLVNILSVPLLLNHLGTERYGMFALVTSILGFMNFSDFGLSLGLQNKLPYLIGQENQNKTKRAISSSFIMLIGISLFLLIVTTTLVFTLDWGAFFNVKSNLAKAEAKYVALAFFICFSISLPFTIGHTIYTSLQQGYIGEMIKALGNILIIVLLYLSVSPNLGTTYFTTIMYAIPGGLGIFITYLLFFRYKSEWLPKLSYVSFSEIKNLLQDSSKYFVLQLFSLGLLTVDSFFVAHYEGASSVSGFNVGIRVVSIISLPLVLINSQILPAINDAVAKNELIWVKRNIKRLFFINTAFIILFSILIYMFGSQVLKFWLSDVIVFSKLEWLAFIILFISSTYNHLISNILLTPKLLNFTMFIVPLSILIIVLLKWIAVAKYSSSLMLILGSISLFLLLILPSLYKFKRIGYI